MAPPCTRGWLGGLPRQRLPESHWHYLNFATGSSAWESREDASTVVAHEVGGEITEFVVQTGLALVAARGLIAQYRLEAVPTTE